VIGKGSGEMSDPETLEVYRSGVGI
jgi:hypothetical protein